MKFVNLGLLLLIVPSPAWAFVPHGYPETYAHQMGHIYFALSCIFILWTIHRNNLQREKGWRYMFYAQMLFILWNVNTFVGHITEFWIEQSQITGGREGWGYFTRYISLEGMEYLYYITKLDHFFLVPAMVLFYMSLREHLGEEAKNLSPSMAVLPLFPILAVDIAGSFLMIVISFLCLSAAIKLYRKNRENTLWSYLVWLSWSYILFSVSRSMGHILQRILVPAGYENIWEFIEPYSGSFNSFTFVVIGSVSLFFVRAYEVYLKMTEDKRKIEAINSELAELNMELETLVAERTMNLMALTVADRVRNPVAVIGWTCKRILEKEEVSDKLEENLKGVIDESNKLESIVKAFETFLKSKQSIFKYEDINEIVKGVVSIVKNEADEKSIAISLNLSENPLRINAQKNLLRAGFSHIIRNAIEATPSGGQITVTSFGDLHNVILSVSDTGSGIPKEDIEKIFDPFFSTKQFRFGMGLPLVKQIVSEHLGTVSVESEIGKGTTFKIAFPVRWIERK